MLTKEKKPFTEDKLTQYYNQRAAKYKHNIDALQWQSEYSQYARFEIIYEHILPECKTLCDLGCGYGDFYNFLINTERQLNYTGIDITAKMIVAAQRAYPSGTFKCTDLNSIRQRHHFDTIIASGVFNLRMENHDDYLYQHIQLMALSAKKQFIFNVLSDKTNRFSRSKEFVYYKKNEIETMLNKCQIKYRIIDDYLPNDMTIIANL